MPRYHYILTLRYTRAVDDSSTAYVHEEGTYRPAAGQTRHDVFADLLGRTRQTAEASPDMSGLGFGSIKPVVMFFSLELDDLTRANA